MTAEALEPRRLLSSGLFAPPQEYTAVAAVNLVTTGDFDGDGSVDVVGVGTIPTGNAPYDGNLYTLLNTGAGEFTDVVTPLPARFSGMPLRVVAAHLNDDAFEDLALVTPRMGTFTRLEDVFLGNGDGSFSPADAPLPVALATAGSIYSADFNNDGRRELAVDNTILYRSGGGFAPLNTGESTGGFPVDLNGDTWTDVFMPGGIEQARLNDGAGGLLPAAPHPGSGFQGLPRGHGGGGREDDLGDFDGDGTLDAIAGSQNGTAQLRLNLGRPGEVTRFYSLLSWFTVPVAGDFNGDGRSDVVVNDYAGTQVLVSRGDGTFRLAGQPAPAAAVFNGDLAVADLNGDGRDDLIAAGGGIGVFLAGAGAETAPVATFGPATGGRPAAVTVPVSSFYNDAPPVTFSLKGPGTGRVFEHGRGSGLSLVLDGTTAASSLTITTPNGAESALTGLQVNGSLRSLTATSTNLVAGDFNISGTVRSLTVLGARAGSRLTIAGAGVPTTIATTVVRDLVLTTQSPISKLTGFQWRDEDPAADVITAPSVGTVVYRPLRTSSESVIFTADLTVTGGGMSLKSLDVRGGISGAIIRTAGSIGSVRAQVFGDTTLFAGVADAVTDLPTSAADFVSQATIGSVSTTAPGESPTVYGTKVAAWSVRRFKVGNVATGIGALPSGLAAVSVGSYARGDAFSLVRRARLTQPGTFDSLDKYVARIV